MWLAGLAAYVKAGMGSLIIDTAAVSKAAFASAGSVFLRRSASKFSQPISPPEPKILSGAFHHFDLEYLGPDKYAELKGLRKDGLSHINSNSSTASGASRDSLDSPKSVVASPVAGQASDPVAAQEVGKPAQDADAKMPSLCAAPVPAAPFTDMVTTSDGRRVPAHEAARSIMESVFIKKGLATPDNPAFQKSLAVILGMVPGQDSADVTQATQRACEAAAAQHDVHAEDNTARNVHAEHSTAAAPASEQVGAALADSNAHPSVAGTAGGEAGEQWAGSLPPTQVAAHAMAAAAENEVVAGAPAVESLQKLEGNSDADEAQRTSLDAGMPQALGSNSAKHC